MTIETAKYKLSEINDYVKFLNKLITKQTAKKDEIIKSLNKAIKRKEKIENMKAYVHPDKNTKKT